VLWPITSIAASQHFGRFRSEAEIDLQSGFYDCRPKQLIETLALRTVLQHESL
jgi:hypothetical protein